MRVVMLSWEYPPRIVGGIARHVEELSEALVSRGHEVHVVTCEHTESAPEETARGVRLHRVTPVSHSQDFIHWIHLLNGAMHFRADRLIKDWVRPGEDTQRRPVEDGIILHAHDWLAHFCARDLKHEFHLPLIATIHATEWGRNHGIHTEMQRQIASTEWQLTYEAWRVIVCSGYMRSEVRNVFQTPADKIDVIPNGVRAGKFDFDFSPPEAARFRAQLAAQQEKLIFFVGRMVPEKGAHLLIEALPKVRHRVPEARLVIVGGGDGSELKTRAEELGVSDFIRFTGYVPDEFLLRLYRVIDVACFPSVYEPFGIVALEAMAAGVPVIVSDAGGLPDVVEHNVSGVVVPRGDSDALADAIIGSLRDPSRARKLADTAVRRAQEVFNWGRIAAQTEAVYERVWEVYRSVEWGS
jgi:glycosyltransferase involved in cell wall biosynthesis